MSRGGQRQEPQEKPCHPLDTEGQRRIIPRIATPASTTIIEIGSENPDHTG